MAYTPTTWIEAVTALGPTNLNNIETGLAAIANLPNAKGDLYAATGADTPARQAVGANDEVLVADSAQSTGIKWAKVSNAMVATNAAIDVSKLAGAYSTYVPTWASSGTQPDPGNAIRNFRYLQIGKLVHVVFQFSMGSTTTFGTGSYSWTLPVTASTTPSQARAGIVYSFDASGSVFNHATVVIASATIFQINYASTWPTGSQVTYGQTTPWTWASSDDLQGSFTYEAA